MLNNLNFTQYSIFSSTKNINSTDEGKSYIIAISLIKPEFHKKELVGVEKLLHEVEMTNTNKIYKISASFSKDKEGKYILPIKIAFKDETQQYNKRVYFERDLTDDILTDITFIEMMFDLSPTDVKRVYI